MNFNQGLKTLKDAGLNIFFAAKVVDLPSYYFDFSPEEKNQTLCFVGHGGRALWEKIPPNPNPLLDPIDTYTLNQLDIFAREVLNDDIKILFPSKDYFLPLQRFSRVMNFSHPSPLGLDISDEFGLWFAFRAVFLTKANIPETVKTPFISPCESCTDRPCLDLKIIKEDDRLKCPIKPEHRYSAQQIDYHRRALKLI